MSAPPVSSVTVPAGQPAQAEHAGWANSLSGSCWARGRLDALASHFWLPSPGGAGPRLLHDRCGGNRWVSNTIHMAAVTQVSHRHSQGRAYYDKKLAEGKTAEEALRALKRQISNAVFARLQVRARRAAAGARAPGGQQGNGSAASAAGLNRAAAPGGPGDRPHAVPAVSAGVAPAAEARPSTSHQVRQSPGKGHGQRAGTPRIVRAAPSTRKGTRRSFPTASRKASSGPTLARGASAAPAGLTARARPKARPRSMRQTSTAEDPHLRRRLLTRC